MTTVLPRRLAAGARAPSRRPPLRTLSSSPSQPPSFRTAMTSSLDAPAAKRAKLSSSDLPFSSGLLEEASIISLRQQVSGSKPYKHAVIPGLFETDFLERAKEELCGCVSFSEKETDICERPAMPLQRFAGMLANVCAEERRLVLDRSIEGRLGFLTQGVEVQQISQTGDLTNLSGLPSAERALLPTLIELRDALYSKEFRSFLQKVTGCGPLSGIKTDMSCAEYGEGSYLLNHDDVIGTRRISFILYLVKDEPKWRPEWGGALELYPVVPSEGDRPNIPETKPSVSIPPAFNQFTFFEVQPGHSFHSVEEVVVEGDGQRGGIGSRLSLSGWFHKPVEGEEGYEEGNGQAPKSSLQQLYASTLKHPTFYSSTIEPLEDSLSDFSDLKGIINPSYLSAKTLVHLQNSFAEESHLALTHFLEPTLASQLEAMLRKEDERMNKGRKRAIEGGQIVNRIPKHEEGEGEGWELVGPPHLQRFVALSKHVGLKGQDEVVELLSKVRSALESDAFGRLLSTLTGLPTSGFTLDVRRFRPGLDYTLARGEPNKHQLDVGLGLTPEPSKVKEKELWDEGAVGGWEVWLDGEEGGDEATYGGGKKVVDGAESGKEEEQEEEEDGPLLSLEPAWNRLSIVLRDPGVMKFVKYVSARAPASRWDVGGEWEVHVPEEEDEE